jgi:THO complex subunit 4
MPWNN